MKMDNKVSACVVLMATFISFTVANPLIRCPAGFYLKNDDENKMLMDERKWQTCTDPGKTTCAVLTHSYREQGDLMSGGTYLPCVSQDEKTLQLIRFYTSEEHVKSVHPDTQEYISSEYELCNDQPCFDFTKPAFSGLTCNKYSYIKDDASGEVLTKVELSATQKCLTHHPNCYSGEIYFVDQETGKPATLYSGGCHQNYGFWWDASYAAYESTGKYCSENDCRPFDFACFCYGDKKIEGNGDHVITHCKEDLCN